MTHLARLKFAGILLFPVFLYFIPVGWLDGKHTVCLFKNIFGWECFGCGITRAVLSAIHFDFVAAVNYNKLVVIVLPLLIYSWCEMLVKLWNSKAQFK